jgi:hypothetical protein
MISTSSRPKSGARNRSWKFLERVAWDPTRRMILSCPCSWRVLRRSWPSEKIASA